MLIVCPWILPNSKAQTNTPLTSTDKFAIPEFNGTISFAVNGSYSKAVLENNVWTFTNLRLNGSQPLENFKISTQNSNVTIFSFIAINFTRHTSRLRYAVEGQGKQIVNLGINTTQNGEWNSLDWSVIKNNNVFMTENEGWSITHDNTLTVEGVTGNVSIVYWGFLQNLPSSNLPFYLQHSVAITIVAVTVVVISVAATIKIVNRKQSNNQVKNTRAN